MFRDKRVTDPDQTRGTTIRPQIRYRFTANLPAHGTHLCLPEMSLVAAIFEDAVPESWAWISRSRETSARFLRRF